MSTETDMETISSQSSFSYEVPKQRTDIITDEELFNSAALKEAAGRLDTAFQTFANILMDTNDFVNGHVNASYKECVFGSYGAQLLEMWNSNVPTFSDFKTNFESWSRAVSVIATRDENSETIAQAIYNNRTNGSDLTTADGRTVAEMREDIILDSAKVDSTTNSRGGNTYRYYDENGELTTRYTNEDGEVWMQHISDENGNLVSTVCTDSEGNTSRIVFHRDADGKVTGRDVAFYDKDGNLLEKAPDSFNDSGYLKTNSQGQTDDTLIVEDNVTDSSTNEDNVTDSSTKEGDVVTTSSTESVTVTSGQQVTINGNEYNFLMTKDGKNYYTLSNDPNAQVYVDGENGPEIYLAYGDKTYTRNEFVNSYKNNLEVGWSATYNNGYSPFDSVGSSSSVSLDGVSSNTSGNSFVYNDPTAVHDNAVALSSINFGEVSLGREQLPEVIYVAPGDDIRWDPFDLFDMKDIHIEGGDTGKYLVLDPNTNTYYAMNSDGSFLADGGNDYDLSSISADRLLSGDTKINTK